VASSPSAVDNTVGRLIAAFVLVAIAVASQLDRLKTRRRHRTV